MIMLYGNDLLQAATLEKLVKDTNLDAVTYLVYQDCTAAKIQPW